MAKKVYVWCDESGNVLHWNDGQGLSPAVDEKPNVRLHPGDIHEIDGGYVYCTEATLTVSKKIHKRKRL